MCSRTFVCVTVTKISPPCDKLSKEEIMCLYPFMHWVNATIQPNDPRDRCVEC